MHIKLMTLLKKWIIGHPKTLQQKFPQYEIGRGTYGSDLRILRRKDGATLKIGAFCSIAAGVQIFLGGEHRIDWVTTYPFNVLWHSANHIKGHPKTKGDVEIGNDVWIGQEAVILSGVKIGDGAVVGVRAVVTANVPPYAVVAGNPARVLKKRFDDMTIQRLLNSKWWNWPESKIEKMLPMLLNHDIERFLTSAAQDKI
ncbi:MAG: CatB-related O-acetyltransferase [Desulfobacterales bacterium]|jgi:acetyltransferase-like isoleucine patch superfamily enzyme|nr:CatB-related O-acetyltransferase [Desulfobacterales bacterium]